MRRMITNKQVDTVNLAEELFKYLKVTNDGYSTEYYFYFDDSNEGQQIALKASADSGPIIDGKDQDGDPAIGLFDNGGDPVVDISYSSNKVYISSSSGIDLTSDTINIQDTGELNYFSLDSVDGIEIYVENGYFKLMNIPPHDPHVAGAIWDDNGVLKISAGQ